ncbi:MAG: fasciclin domain-containing protein [Spirochaetaceae bacterium]|nr:MAG: fasciclin domain-containing protein [Spirochaetaceae bacterium]
MRIRNIALALVMVAVLIAPLAAQVRPGDSDSGTVMDVIADHDELGAAYELFGSEFDGLLSGDGPVALFAPTDEVLGQIAAGDVSEAELQSLFNRHVATGLASREPIEFIDWFVTDDGEQVSVSVEDDTVLLNDSATVVEAIAASNGIVYIIDAALDS